MTKIPTEILELAISGGWTGGLQAKTHTKDYIIGYVEMNLERVALDREFWVCLGVALRKDVNPETHSETNWWYWKAKEYLDLVITGQDPTEYWNELLANQKQV